MRFELLLKKQAPSSPVEAVWFEGLVNKTPLHSFLSLAAGRKVAI